MIMVTIYRLDPAGRAMQFYIRYLDAQSKPLALTIDVFSIVVVVYN
jgi:hypothetical protein